MRKSALIVTVLILTAVVGATGAHAEGEEYEPHSLLIGFEHNLDPSVRAQAHARVGALVMNTFDWLDVDVVKLPASMDPIEGAKRYRAESGVRYADLNRVVRASGIPNDTYFNDLWGLDNTGQLTYGYNGDLVFGNGSADVNAPEGWDLAFGGAFPSTGGARVGILDTGIDSGHPDLAGAVKACARALSGYGTVTNGNCGDDNGHGTHVAGTIAARANNGTGVAGVAPNAELAICKILASNGSGYVADLVGGSYWLRTTGAAKVISMSLGHAGSDSSESSEMQAAYNAGVVMVAAAGNRGTSSIEYPAGYGSVISVASIDAKDRHSTFSQYNSDVELAAPGEDILSTIPGGYDYYYGTSMATPHVSGVAAMIISTLGLDAAQTRARLQTSAADLGAAGRDNYFGFGRVNLQSALADAPLQPPTITSPAEAARLSATSITISGATRADATVEVSEGATSLGTATANGVGAWSITRTFTEGTHSISAVATLGWQTSAASSLRTFTVDTVAPAAPVITSPAEGALLGSKGVAITGTAEPSATVRVREGATLVATTAANGSGDWSVAVTMTEGAHSIVADAQDGAGNTGPLAGARTFTVDAPPPAPTLSYPPEGAHLSGPTLPLSGTGQPGATITVKESSSVLGTTTVAGDGTWNKDVTFIDGNHTIAVTASDGGGTSSSVTRSFATGPGPLTPVILTPTAGAYLKSPVTITGTSDLLSTIKVYEGTTLRGQGNTRSDGKWTVSANFPSDGPHTITVYAYDYSNTPSPPATRTFTTDSTAPTASFDMADPSVRAGISISLTGGATDNIGVARVHVSVVRPVGGAAFEGDAECPCGPGATDIDWTLDAVLLPGVYNVYVNAYDVVGNPSPTKKITLVVA